MELIYFTAAAIVLYLVSDRLLDAAERAAGRRFEYRTIWFFCILLVLAAVTFAAIRRFIGV